MVSDGQAGRKTCKFEADNNNSLAKSLFAIGFCQKNKRLKI